jgi:hypothetical protein
MAKRSVDHRAGTKGGGSLDKLNSTKSCVVATCWAHDVMTSTLTSTCGPQRASIAAG